MNTRIWPKPAVIAPNNFKHKSLSCFSYNIAIGCEHACTFCYVPQVSTIRMTSALKPHGVTDPDKEWGDYVFLRQWDQAAFMASLQTAERRKPQELNPDGNRAVMLCTTTDPYQVGGNALVLQDGQLTPQQFNQQRRLLVRFALECILKFSTLTVRILTRSPLAREDFDLFKQFGNRLLFGMSLPTLNNRLAKIYEPHAPAPSQRLATLQAAKAAGLNVFVAVAPVYPECDAADMNATLRAVRELDPVTIFMEPINIRAENVARIEEEAAKYAPIVMKAAAGKPVWLDEFRQSDTQVTLQKVKSLRTEVFATPATWRNYAVKQLDQFESIARSLDIGDNVIHLWPDASLGSKDARRQFAHIADYGDWLAKHWNKISAWPK